MKNEHIRDNWKEDDTSLQIKIVFLLDCRRTVLLKYECILGGGNVNLIAKTTTEKELKGQYHGKDRKENSIILNTLLVRDFKKNMRYTDQI